MKEISTTLFHRALLPEHSSPTTHPTIIMLHGRGADENDLLGLAPYLDKRFMVISPRAPFPFLGGGGYAWYDIEEVGKVDKEMFRSSYDKLISFVQDVLHHYPIDPNKLFLFGFSMGTVMSYALALTRPELFCGIVANSGYVPEGTHLVFQWDKLSNVDFLVAHGTFDPVIPISFARQARELFTASNAPVTYKEYPVAHQVSEEGLNDVALWLKQKLDKQHTGLQRA